jgi:hypothetical protein
MSLADPQSITIGSAISLARVSDDGFKSQYFSADRLVRETVSSQYTTGQSGRTKTLFRVDKDVIAADPITALNRSLTGSCYVVFDYPLLGFSTADKIAMFSGMNTQLTAATNTVLTKILQLEH